MITQVEAASTGCQQLQSGQFPFFLSQVSFIPPPARPVLVGSGIQGPWVSWLHKIPPDVSPHFYGNRKEGHYTHLRGGEKRAGEGAARQRGLQEQGIGLQPILLCNVREMGMQSVGLEG